MRALLLALLLVLPTAPALAKRPVPVMVLPFASEGPARELSDALELELELHESLVLSSPQPLYAELDDRELNEGELRDLDKERVADALAILEQQALLYGVMQGDDVVIVLFRTNDAAIVWAERTSVSDGSKNVNELSARAIEALAKLHERMRLGSEELIALGLEQPAPEPPVTTTTTRDNAAESDASAGEGVNGSDGELEDDDDGASRAGSDRLGRLVLAWAPSLLYYRACQPADPDSYVPFSCAEKPGVPSTEVLVSPLQAPLGGAAQLELYPLPFVGLEVGASLFSAKLRATVADDDDVVSLTPDDFYTVGGDVTAALALRLPFGDHGFGGGVALRAGYHLGFAVTDEVVLDTGVRKILFPLLPTYFSHHALVGIGGELGFADLLRVSLDADGLFGPHLEGPVQVGNDAFAVGGRARLGIDVHVGGGVLLATMFEGSAVSVGSSGTAPDVHRYTLALEPFESGQLVVADARFGIGIGYRY